MFERALHVVPYVTSEHMGVVETRYGQAQMHLAHLPSEGRHIWHSGNFTAAVFAAAAGPYDSIM